MVGFINKESSLTQCVIRTKGTEHCQRQEAKPRFATSLVLSKLSSTGGFWVTKLQRQWQDFRTLPGKALS